MQIALEKRSVRSSAVSSLVAQAEQSIVALSAVLEGLETAKFIQHDRPTSALLSDLQYTSVRKKE